MRREGKVSDASILEGGREVARIAPHGGMAYRMEAPGDGSWDLDPRVSGEVRPFSLEVTAAGDSGSRVLTILNHIFVHAGAFYMFMGVPEHVHPRDHILGQRFIIRLDKFPFSSLEEVDRETWGRLRRLRGVSVAEMRGLGPDGHTVKLSEELRPIGLILAAASYLLYSTA